MEDDNTGFKQEFIIGAIIGGYHCGTGKDPALVIYMDVSSKAPQHLPKEIHDSKTVKAVIMMPEEAVRFHIALTKLLFGNEQ